MSYQASWQNLGRNLDEMDALVIREIEKLHEDGVALLKDWPANELPVTLVVRYQAWYTKSCAAIAFVAPDRLDEFKGCYEPAKNRKSLEVATYRISDALTGFTAQHVETATWARTASARFRQQLGILAGCSSLAKSRLHNLEVAVRAEVLDSETESADELRKAGHIRSAGVICGVVIERHLLAVCAAHKVAVRKKHPTIGDLNGLLKKAEVLDPVQWRRVQHMSDVRNYCGHAKEREPTDEEVAQLVRDTSWLIKRVN